MRTSPASWTRRPKDEDKLIGASLRIEAGTYLPPARLRSDTAAMRERLGSLEDMTDRRLPR